MAHKASSSKRRKVHIPTPPATRLPQLNGSESEPAQRAGSRVGVDCKIGNVSKQAVKEMSVVRPQATTTVTKAKRAAAVKPKPKPNPMSTRPKLVLPNDSDDDPVTPTTSRTTPAVPEPKLWDHVLQTQDAARQQQDQDHVARSRSDSFNVSDSESEDDLTTISKRTHTWELLPPPPELLQRRQKNQSLDARVGKPRTLVDVLLPKQPLQGVQDFRMDESPMTCTACPNPELNSVGGKSTFRKATSSDDRLAEHEGFLSHPSEAVTQDIVHSRAYVPSHSPDDSLFSLPQRASRFDSPAKPSSGNDVGNYLKHENIDETLQPQDVVNTVRKGNVPDDQSSISLKLEDLPATQPQHGPSQLLEEFPGLPSTAHLQHWIESPQGKTMLDADFKASCYEHESFSQRSKRDEYRCSSCDVLLEAKHAILCSICAITPGLDPILDRVISDHKLCEEQTNILRLAAQGINLFYTGGAGTGKSTVSRALVSYLRKHNKRVNVVAPTGLTALNVDGRTIHSFAGWNIDHDKRSFAQLRADAGRYKLWRRIVRSEVLIIDEISIVSSNTLERLNCVLQVTFSQLPPVKPFETCLECGRKTQPTMWSGTTNETPRQWVCLEHGLFNDEDKWAFAATVWQELKLHSIQLHQIHRQQDADFTATLHKYRVGIPLTDIEDDLLWSHDETTEIDDLRIYPTRRQVDIRNSFQLDQLSSTQYDYACVDNYQWSDDHSHFKAWIEDRHRYDVDLPIKIGTPVIFLTNILSDWKLANGSQGTVVDMVSVKDVVLPRSNDGSQEHGLNHWILHGDHAEYQEREIREFVDRMSHQWLPVVRFKNDVVCTIFPYYDVNSLGTTHICPPELPGQPKGILCESHEAGALPYNLISRTQIPLLAAWAITTHKSQGMTLDKAVIDMERAWEHGQMYVAMSRVRSLQGLRVDGVAIGKASRADETVKKFMKDTKWIETT